MYACNTIIVETGFKPVSTQVNPIPLPPQLVRRQKHGIQVLSSRPLRLFTADRPVHRAHSIVINVFQLVIVPAFSRIVCKSIPCPGGRTALSRDERIVDLRVLTPCASGTIDIETGIVHLGCRLPSQTHTTIAICLCLEVEQGDGGRRFCWSWRW